MSDTDFALGLIAGEGSFYIELNKRLDMSHNIGVRPSFALSVRYDDEGMVRFMEDVLGFGEVKVKERSGRNNLVEIRVRRQDSIENLIKWMEGNITNSFKRTSKYEQYQEWKEIYQLTQQMNSADDAIEIVKRAKTLSDSNQGKNVEEWIQLVEEEV